MSKVRFVEWTEPVVRERDLPVGTRYTYKMWAGENGGNDLAELIISDDGRSYCVRHNHGLATFFMHQCTISDKEVIVREYPNGHTPARATPKTLGDVFDMVGKNGRVAAVTCWPGYKYPVATYDIGDIGNLSYALDDTDFTLLGFLVQD